MEDLELAQAIERKFLWIQQKRGWFAPRVWRNADGEISVRCVGITGKNMECIVKGIDNLQLAVQFYKRAKEILEQSRWEKVSSRGGFGHRYREFNAEDYAAMRLALTREYGADPQQAPVEAYAAMMLLVGMHWRRFTIASVDVGREHMPLLPILPPISSRRTPSGALVCAVCDKAILCQWWEKRNCIIRTHRER